MRFIALLLIVVLSGCSALHFDPEREQEGKVLIGYNINEVRIIDINGEKYPEWHPFSSNSEEYPAGPIKLKVKLHWHDTYHGILYESSVLKDLCYNAEPGFTYWVKVEMTEYDWTPSISLNDHEKLLK